MREGCLAVECGHCKFCLDMLEFGGAGKMHQLCVGSGCLQKFFCKIFVHEINDYLYRMKVTGRKPATKP